MCTRQYDNIQYLLIRHKYTVSRLSLKPAFHGACFWRADFAALLSAALVTNNSADNVFPWRRHYAWIL